MNYSWQETEKNGTGEERSCRLYYLAGRFITQQTTAEELEEISTLPKNEDENEEYSQTFVILTSTGYLTDYFRGMDLDVSLPDIYSQLLRGLASIGTGNFTIAAIRRNES